jgi:hypothetical protein
MGAVCPSASANSAELWPMNFELAAPKVMTPVLFKKFLLELAVILLT